MIYHGSIRHYGSVGQKLDSDRQVLSDFLSPSAASWHSQYTPPMSLVVRQSGRHVLIRQKPPTTLHYLQKLKYLCIALATKKHT